MRRTDSANSYILVISDYFTKWTESFAVADMRATTVADILAMGKTELLHTRERSRWLGKELGRKRAIDIIGYTEWVG